MNQNGLVCVACNDSFTTYNICVGYGLEITVYPLLGYINKCTKVAPNAARMQHAVATGQRTVTGRRDGSGTGSGSGSSSRSNSNCVSSQACFCGQQSRAVCVCVCWLAN